MSSIVVQIDMMICMNLSHVGGSLPVKSTSPIHVAAATALSLYQAHK